MLSVDPNTELAAKARDILAKLIAIPTVSRDSNLAIIEWIEDYLADLGVESHRVANPDEPKASLFATVGPSVEGGVILSGHSDVVPVDGQPWTSDPWTLAERDGRLFGRGTCDMKGFIALALAAVPMFLRGSKPVHLAFSHDEEIGCKGAPALIAEMAGRVPTPRCAIIGEPSMMRIVDGHKGIAVHEVEVTGHEAHSSLTHLGLSANMVAIELMHDLAELARSLYASERADPRFEPPHATLTIGLIEGGTAANILARKCRFTFDLRTPPAEDAESILAPFKARCEALSKEMAAAFPGTGIEVRKRSSAPPLGPQAGDDVAAFVRTLTGDNGAAIAVPYAAEAGQFQQGDFPSVICGPGSIEQAHQPDEFIAIEQFERGAIFMQRLAGALS